MKVSVKWIPHTVKWTPGKAKAGTPIIISIKRSPVVL